MKQRRMPAMRQWPASNVLGQLLRFGVTGGFSTLLTAGSYWLLTLRGLPPLLANVIAYLIGMVFGYLVHSTWSFKGHGRRDNLARTGGRFLFVSLVGLSLNSGFVWLLTGPLHGATWWPIVPMVLITPLFTFALNRYWVFGG